MPARTFPVPFPLDLRLTLGPLRRGGADPCMRLARRAVVRATRTPEGPATLQLELLTGEIRAEAWGPGAEWSLEHGPRLVGTVDDPDAFRPAHPALRALVTDLRGLRLPRCDAIVELLVPTVLEQKVTGVEARRSYAHLVHRYGSPAPGPFRLKVPPSPAALAALPYYEWHPLGVERKRAEVVRVACRHAERLERLVDSPPDDAAARLRTLPGIGPWSAAHVVGLSHGDPDQVIVGDYHLPHLVGWVLAGEVRGTDRRMLELLDPFVGQRGRAQRLIVAGGDRPARVLPRRPLRSIAAI